MRSCTVLTNLVKRTGEAGESLLEVLLCLEEMERDRQEGADREQEEAEEEEVRAGWEERELGPARVAAASAPTVERWLPIRWERRVMT